MRQDHVSHDFSSLSGKCLRLADPSCGVPPPSCGKPHHGIHMPRATTRVLFYSKESPNFRSLVVGWHHQLNGQVWVSSRRWWRTRKPDTLQSMGSQRVRHDSATEQHKIHQITTNSHLCWRNRPHVTLDSSLLHVSECWSVSSRWKHVTHLSYFWYISGPHVNISTTQKVINKYENRYFLTGKDL